MSKPVRIVLISFSAFVVLVLFLGVAGYFLAQSDWLREKLRREVVEQAEIAIGGKVDIHSFSLDWTGLTADVDGVVIHGTEAAGQAPLLAVDHVRIRFRIISLMSRDIRLAGIEVVHPKVHLIIDNDGGTNLPRPKVSSTKNTAETILDLKIAKFDVKYGEAFVESPGLPPANYPWSGTGQNLAAVATFDRKRDRYSGDVQLGPARLALNGYGPIDADVHASAMMERTRVYVSDARVKTPGSDIHLTNLNIGPFPAPVETADFEIKASSAEAVRVLGWKIPLSGPLNVTGNVRYTNPEKFEIKGGLRGAGLTYGPVHNIRITGNVDASEKRLYLTSLHANVWGGQATGSAETTGYDLYHVNGKIVGLGVRELAALGSSKPVPYDGVVSGTLDLKGRIRDLSGSGLVDAMAQLTVGPAATGPAVHGEISAHYTGTVAKLELGHSWLELPNTRVDADGTLGANLAVKMNTKDLNDLNPVLSGHALPFTLKNGSASFAGTVTGALDDPHIAGHAEVHNAVYQNRAIDSAVADVTASSKQASAVNLTLIYDGMTAQGAGSIGLVNWATSDASVISGNVSAGNVDLTHALTLAGASVTEVSGTVAVKGSVSGTLGQPVGVADVTLTKGLIYQQPYDSVTAHVQYLSVELQTASGVFVSGPKRVNFDVRYPHAGQAFPEGTLEITANSNAMALNQIALVRQRQPDIQGSAQFKGSAAVKLVRDAKGVAQAELLRVDGDASMTGIALAGHDLGDSHFTARTAGTQLTATFDSNAAKAVIKGQTTVELKGEDRANGSITFSNLGLSGLASLITTKAQAENIDFDGSAEGQVNFSGPLFTPKDMTASATLRQIEVHPIAGTPLAINIPGFSLRNAGPLQVSFAKMVLRVDAARFNAPETDVTVSGTADLATSAPLNLRVAGDVSLAIVRNFVPDLASSGTIAVTGNVRGSFNNPDLNGHATIRGGEFHYADFANGLSNATSEIVFSGSRATIQSFTADTGGGKFTGTGFASLNAGALAFQFSAKTKDVRLRYPQGVSSISDSEIELVRNPQRSSISGTVTVRRLVFNPQQDSADMLADISRTTPTPSINDNSLAGMNLDIVIQTAPDVALQSKVAESIQADATLRLRGTVASPALLGRVNISQGNVLFFGNKYSISRGSISFYNATKIDPILDVDLQTRARGVDVTLTVTGPPSHLGLTYRSDPPLEFSDIVALLATGRTPDDPSLALRGNAPTPSFEQLGASTLIGQTLATPLAGRLQRFFGVSRIKIDPQLAGVGGTPGARLTVEQQVTPDILFTYVTDVSNTSQQLIRAEWAFNQRWSAILAREENGYVGVDFEYKRRLK